MRNNQKKGRKLDGRRVQGLLHQVHMGIRKLVSPLHPSNHRRCPCLNGCNLLSPPYLDPKPVGYYHHLSSTASLFMLLYNVVLSAEMQKSRLFGNRLVSFATGSLQLSAS